MLQFLGIEGSVREMRERGLLNQAANDEDEEDNKGKETKEYEPKFKSICKVIDAETIRKMNAQESEVRWEYGDYLFENVETAIEEEVNYGQRAFNRNMHILCNQLIGFYEKTWPKQYAETVEKIK